MPRRRSPRWRTPTSISSPGRRHNEDDAAFPFGTAAATSEPPDLLILLLTVLSPVLLVLYKPATSTTMLSMYLANPAIAGGVAGAILFGLLTIFELDRACRSRVDILTDAVVSPLTTALTRLLALLMAVLLNRQLKGMAIFRTLVFIPVITSMVAVSLVWSMLYEDNSGLLNILLGYLGLGPVHWLTDTNMAMISIAIMSVWKGLGYNMTIFLAGLQGVPGELYEAATIDGANSVQKFFKITVPMIGPTTYFVTLMALIGSLQVFDQVNIMTGGGPVDATKTVAFYLYQYGFQFYKMGYACAAAYVLFILVFIVSLIQNISSKKWADLT